MVETKPVSGKLHIGTFEQNIQDNAAAKSHLLKKKDSVVKAEGEGEPARPVNAASNSADAPSKPNKLHLNFFEE